MMMMMTMLFVAADHGGDDGDVIDAIVQLQNRGISVEICTADNETNSKNQKKLQSILHWKMIKKPYLHAKVMKTRFLPYQFKK